MTQSLYHKYYKQWHHQLIVWKYEKSTLKGYFSKIYVYHVGRTETT